jgi:diacylglycerol kinase (ATP)
VKAKIILNPYANRWRARAQVPAIESACRDVGLDFDLVQTAAPGQAIREAASAVTQNYDVVVAAGGDGTVSEVVNGLISVAGEGTHPLGIIPIGTGNDFSDMAGLPRDVPQAVHTIASGTTRRVDAGRIEADANTHYFDNNCALAMEPLVSIENMRMTRFSGNLRYVVAMIKALLKLKAWHMRIAWDGGDYVGPAYLLSVCNSARTGGIFPMAPGAMMDDGLFDFVFAPELPKTIVLSIVVRLFRGTHIHHEAITFARTTGLTINSEPGTPIHADGELLTESARRIEYQVLPGKITLMTPDKVN